MSLYSRSGGTVFTTEKEILTPDTVRRFEPGENAAYDLDGS